MRHVKNHIKVILFDHDDTLVRTIEAKWAEHKHIAKKYYGKDLSDDELKKHWGKPLRALMGVLYDTDDLEEALKLNLAIHKNFPKKLDTDTISVLQHLHDSGKKVGVITATHSSSLNYDLDSLGISSELFDYKQTEEDTKYHKPDSRVFIPALAWIKQKGIKPAEVLYVGDGLQDMKAALGAGFEFIGVTTGLVSQKEFKKHGALTIKRLRELTET